METGSLHRYCNTFRPILVELFLLLTKKNIHNYILILILRCFPLFLVPGGALNVPSHPSTNPPPTKTSGCSTSQLTRASDGTFQTRDQTWFNSCWPDLSTIIKRPCRFTSRPTTHEPIRTNTAEPGYPGWTKRRMRRENITECTRKVGTIRRKKRRSVGCASCRPSF